MKYFFDKLVKAPEYTNGSIIFDQGYINKHIALGIYNISVYYLSISEAVSGWVMLNKLGLYYYEDIVKSICYIIV